MLAAQLGSITWTLDSRERIKIESTDDMCKRELPSPDRADSSPGRFAPTLRVGVVNVEDHAGHSTTGNLMEKAW